MLRPLYDARPLALLTGEVDLGKFDRVVFTDFAEKDS